MAKILLVDDDQSVLETLSSAIESRGHFVVRANDGLEGLLRYREQEFDLVITDIIMPNEEGLGMISKLRKHDRPAKIIAISGGGRTSNHEFLKIAEALGAIAVMKKPIRLGELFEMLDICLQ
jgi:CheY-like chemotaxis protein